MSTYRTLNAAKVVETLERLQARVAERFPDSGLSKVCAETTALSAATAARVAALQRPRPLLRAAAWALAALGAAAFVAAWMALHPEELDFTAQTFIPVLEPAVNLLVLFGGAIWFLVTLEERLNRRDALTALHELRALAHVVDMHQLTKDPTIILSNHPRTAASPARAMSEFELTRYLEYCAELLALIGKCAALYAEKMRDPVIIEGVNDLENLCASLGRKIWQKIMIIRQLDEKRAM